MTGSDLFAQLPPGTLEYLRRLRAGLAPLPESEREEIVRETAAHLLDRLAADGAAGSPGGALGELGEPEAYAARFVSNYRISSALASGSPVALATQVLRLLGTSAWAFCGGTVVLIFYTFAFGMLIVGLAKPIAPSQTGLFLGPGGGFSLGIIDAASRAGAREALGYWLIPLALIAGVLLLLLAKRLSRAFLRSIRR
ncbi:MAG: HAAS signaling domain-containing protein [Candidatus Krumholzibacteriia bacterium]